MKKIVKYSLITAGICILAGGALGLAGRLMGGRGGFYVDSYGMHTYSDRKRNMKEGAAFSLEKTKLEDLTDVDIYCLYHDILLVNSEDDSFYLEYVLPQAKSEPEYSVSGGKLNFRAKDTGDRLDLSGLNFFMTGFWTTEDYFQQQTGYVKLYLPKRKRLDTVLLYSSDSNIESVPLKAGSVTITGKYGTINTEGIEADTVSVTSSDGTVRCQNGTAKEYTVTNTYGSTRLDGLKADKFIMESSDGSCKVTGLDAKAVNLKNMYGNVELELTGQEKEYDYDIRNKYGTIRVNGRTYSEEDDFEENHGTGRMIKIKSSDGSVSVKTQ